MFRKSSEQSTAIGRGQARVDSVLGAGVAWQGQISGTGGVRIEGAFDGEIALRGLVVIGEQGRVTCEHIRAMTVIVAGSVKGDITAHKLEITRTGRVWGDVVAASFSTEEGAFLRGKITMEEQVDLGLGPEPIPEGDADESSLAEGGAEPPQ
ncbi:MAG: polymer-forming cytoskeletal protein [Anaerolineales bacterium]